MHRVRDFGIVQWWWVGGWKGRGKKDRNVGKARRAVIWTARDDLTDAKVIGPEG